MPAIPSKPRKTQAPIFQRRPDLAAKFDKPHQTKAAPVMPSTDLPAQAEPVTAALVTPLCVFAAGRGGFEVIVRGDFSPKDALAIIFGHLPLQENGWSFDRTEIEPAGSRDGWPLWRVWRVTV